MELKGKVAFITGAAQGLGKGYAEALLEKGVKVFFGDLSQPVGEATRKEFADRFGQENVRFAAFDVSDHQKFTDAFKQAVSEYGRVDIMINNAGFLNESRWQQMISVNLAALIHGTQTAIDHMRKDKGGHGGRIVNISSSAGLKEYPQMPAYCATKHAVKGYTASLAGQKNCAELGIEYGILCPDGTDTDLFKKLDKDKIHFYEDVMAANPVVMPVSKVVAAFMDLVQLEKMNGALLLVTLEETAYQKIECRSLSTAGSQ